MKVFLRVVALRLVALIPMNAASRDRVNGFYCAAVVLVAIALTRPLGESGVNDDWSYTKTALDLAQSGQLRYNGWAAAMVMAAAPKRRRR